MIVIDGSTGEGGGQILRSALSLSLLTGQPFNLTNVRAGRPKPGLRPQHLSAVQAAAQISRASVDGDRKGSSQITFIPGPVQPGDYHFDIGTAGATSLVLQTLLLPLALVQDPSHLTITGGTHVPWSPCFHYLDWHWARFLSRMGIHFNLSLINAGFYPRGGGELRAVIPGSAELKGVDLSHRGPLQRVYGLSAVANLPLDIAERQRRQSRKRLMNLITTVDVDVQIESLPAQSKGTMLLLLAEFEHTHACFFALGAPGKPAERVADEAVEDLAKFLKTDGAVDHWLADQLLLPLAISNQPCVLRTSEVTQHLLTNLEVIRHFLAVDTVVDGPLGTPAFIRLHT